jgi:hypothetical protein
MLRLCIFLCAPPVVLAYIYVIYTLSIIEDHFPLLSQNGYITGDCSGKLQIPEIKHPKQLQRATYWFDLKWVSKLSSIPSHLYAVSRKLGTNLELTEASEVQAVEARVGRRRLGQKLASHGEGRDGVQDGEGRAPLARR